MTWVRCSAALLAAARVAAGAFDAAADRAGVEAALAAMSAAVMEGDKAGYLRHVDQRDAEFAMEQRHWADDLDRHKPLEFVLEISDDPVSAEDDPVFDGDRATLTLRMRYRMSVGHAKGERGKRAVWRGVFAKRDADGAGPEPTRWLYAGEDWMEVSGTYGDASNGTGGAFVVRHLKGSEGVAAQVVEAFPGAKAHVDEGFGVRVTRPLLIKLYQSMEHLKAWVYLSMPDEVLGGWNEPGESIKFMANYTSGVDRWRGAFAHEYGHVATWELGPAVKRMPWWMAEGVAELAAEEFTNNREYIHRMMLRLAKEEKLCAWEAIADYDTAEQRVKRMAYHQGQHLMGYVSERWGRRARNEWIGLVANGEPLPEGTRKALGVTFEELDAQWRRSLADGAVDPEARTPSDGG